MYLEPDMATQTLHISSFNLLYYFQPGFPLPTFHCGNKVNQPNNLIFSIFLQPTSYSHIQNII